MFGLPTNPRIQKIIAIVLFTLFYFFAAKFGLNLAYLNASATSVWLGTGIALSFLLLKGSWLWPGVFLGALFVNWTITPNFTALGIAIGNTLEAVLGTWLIKRYAHGEKAFDHPNDALKFLILIGVLSVPISATIGVISLSLGNFSTWNDFFPIWITWWLGDMVSAIIIAPLILIWLGKPLPALRKRMLPEGIFVALFLLFMGQIIFGNILPSDKQPFVYLTLLPLLWAALRFGQHGASMHH